MAKALRKVAKTIRKVFPSEEIIAIETLLARCRRCNGDNFSLRHHKRAKLITWRNEKRRKVRFGWAKDCCRGIIMKMMGTSGTYVCAVLRGIFALFYVIKAL